MKLRYVFSLLLLFASAVACTNASVYLRQLNSLAPQNSKYFLYSTNYGAHSVSAFQFDSVARTLNFQGSVILSPSASPMGMTSDPTGRYLFVSDDYSISIFQYTIDSVTGQLVAMAGSGVNPGYGDHFIAFDPVSMTLFSPATNTNGMSFNASSGSLGAATPYTAGSNPWSATVCGAHLYVTNTGAGTVSGYNISQTGVLSAISTTTAGGGNPNEVVCDAANRFLFVANLNGYSISAFAIQSDGTLIAASGSPFSVTGNCASVAVDPLSKYLLATSYDGLIYSFAINHATGALTQIGSYASGTNPNWVVIDPTGKFVFNSNIGSSDIYAYNLNTDGTLTPMNTNPINVTGASPKSLVMVTETQ